VLPVVVVTTQRPAPVEAPGVSGRDRVGLGFMVLYALAFMASCLMLIAPLLVTLALWRRIDGQKANSTPVARRISQLLP